MNTRSVFKTSYCAGPLMAKAKSVRKKRIVGTLMLTSLIDAFSILVVYLLMFFSDTAEMTYVSSDIQLPKASSIERLDRFSIIQIKPQGYFVDQKELNEEDIVAYLVDLKKTKNLSQLDSEELKDTITIQADKSISYSRLSPVIQACSHAGFSHIKFAVLSE